MTEEGVLLQRNNYQSRTLSSGNALKNGNKIKKFSGEENQDSSSAGDCS
jgi:hypothetical protein